jgi:subtilisin family serine protease
MAQGGLMPESLCSVPFCEVPVRRSLVLLTACSLTSAVLTASPAVGAVESLSSVQTSASEPASVPDELLVGYARGASARDRADARSRAGARLVSVMVQESPGRSAVELVAARAGGRGQSERRFEADPKVAYAEPNWVHTHAATSNDPAYVGGSLWGMYGDATTPANQYGSQAGEAWSAGNTGGDVYVGVIDEGIQITHPDLDANIWTNPLDPADGVDNDGNGYVDDVNGWDFDGGNNTVYDGTGDDHGTHVAGTIGAEGGNGVGVAGVAWDVTLISAKFLGGSGGTTANAIRAVDYLTDLKTRHKINLVATNNSWGGGGYSQGLYDAIERANVADILFIAAAGNGGRDGTGDDNDKTPHYPSSYANTNVVAVASLTSSGAKSTFSNYGATSVDLGAPGSGISSTLPDNTYGSYSGTSMATPHVTGAAVLYATANPGSSAATIKSGLLASTLLTSSLTKTVTGGRLDASSFFLAGTPVVDTTPPSAPTDVTATGGNAQVDLSWPANTETDLAGYEVWRGDVTTGPVASVGKVTSWTDSNVTNGTTYTYSLVAHDLSGNRSAASLTVSATPAAPSVSALTLLSAKGYKVKGGAQQVDLTWSGGDTTAQVTVVRTGTTSASQSTENDGSYTDKTGRKGAGTYTYTVCQGGACSNAITVTF